MLVTEKLHLLSPIGGIPKQSSQDSGACTGSISSSGLLYQCGNEALHVQGY